jgi:hypothetical protein
MPELLAQVERGDLVPWQVTLPPLPAKAGCNVRAVADDLACLFGVQAAAGDDRPLLYASRWASARLGIDREVISRALRCLVKAEIIEHVRSLKPLNGGREGPRCYTLGAGARVHPSSTLLAALSSEEAVVKAFVSAFDATELAA